MGPCQNIEFPWQNYDFVMISRQAISQDFSYVLVWTNVGRSQGNGPLPKHYIVMTKLWLCCDLKPSNFPRRNGLLPKHYIFMTKLWICHDVKTSNFPRLINVLHFGMNKNMGQSRGNGPLPKHYISVTKLWLCHDLETSNIQAMSKHGTKLRQWALARSLHFHDKIMTLSQVYSHLVLGDGLTQYQGKVTILSQKSYGF